MRSNQYGTGYPGRKASGAIAQLEERLVCIQKARGSSPLSSTGQRPSAISKASKQSQSQRTDGSCAPCQAAGWQVVLFSTPAGRPVPAADVVLACPLTFNSVSKFANVDADNVASGVRGDMAVYG